MTSVVTHTICRTAAWGLHAGLLLEGLRQVCCSLPSCLQDRAFASGHCQIGYQKQLTVPARSCVDKHSCLDR